MDGLEIGDVCVFRDMDGGIWEDKSRLVDYKPELGYPYITDNGLAYKQCLKFPTISRRVDNG